MSTVDRRIKISAYGMEDIYSLRAPESWEYRPDDRQERIEVIGGVIVDDNGHVEEGDIISCTAIFSKTDWVDRIKPLWKERKLITITDEAGEERTNARIVLKSYKYYEKFPQYVVLTLEFWFCNKEQRIF